MALHGNHPEALRDLMLAWIARHPPAPLEDEWVLVQSNGVAQWLRLSLARNAGRGGIGIAAALRTELPASFIWQAYRAVLGEQSVPATSPFDKELLTWRLMRLLPSLLAEPVFAPLARFLAEDADLRKRHQLAERLADLFDQYQVYRADWLDGWAEGANSVVNSRGGSQPVADELRWQPRLWRALLDDVGAEAAAGGRAAVHRRFIAAAAGRQGERPAGLPRRLIVFGISSLPQQALEVLAALARWTQVLMCVHNPCQYDWSEIVADKDLLRAERRRQSRRPGSAAVVGDDELHLHAQPLLAAWGRQGRDFIRLLDAHDERQSYAERFAAIGQRVDCFEANAGDSLLQQLQDDIRDLRPLDETRSKWPAIDAATEHSMRFHVTHGAQREVEVLHDQLLSAFAADPSLQPRDVIVMVPDVAAYAPHVQAVFGLLGADDPRHVPYSLADQVQRHHDPLLGALEKLLALPQSRIAASDLLDWLEVPALRARFGIEEQQLPLLHRWIAAANVRWGLHAEQRESLDLPPGLAQNSWDFGLQRMLLGYAVGSGADWAGIEPLDEIGGLDAALLGPLVQLLEKLEAHWRALAEPASPTVWGERLRSLLADFFEADEDKDGFTLQRLAMALERWLDACAAAGLVEALPLSVVREHWLAQIDRPNLNQPFFGGAVTFATLMPMRAIPFRFVALLGMNDGDYPRSRAPMDFDLMGLDFRPGDRSRREDDRYLFLEALLSARQQLHISWVGRSIHDDSERPPSVLVAQLRDHLAAGWRLAGDQELAQQEAGERLLAVLTVQHRLQPFHADYFSAGGDPRLFSHAREWRTGPPECAADGPPEGATDDAPAMLPWSFEGPLELRLVADFLKDPVKSFFRQRLGIHFDEDDSVGEDEEPFAIGPLENWKLQDELIQVQKAALDARAAGAIRDAAAEAEPGRVAVLPDPAAADRLEALQAQFARIRRRGALPAGHFADLVQAELAQPMEAMFEDYARALARWPVALPDEALDHLPEGRAESLRLVDWLDNLRCDDAGERCRLLLTSGSLLKDRRWQLVKLVPFWVAHLAAQLDGPPITSCIVSKSGTAQLKPLAREQARELWSVLLDALLQGMERPLPLAPRTAVAWLQKGGSLLDIEAQAPFEAARAAYEGGYEQDGGERRFNAYLRRAWPDFDALWADGEFARWTIALLQPIDEALVRAASREER